MTVSIFWEKSHDECMETQDLKILFGRRKDGYHSRRSGFTLGTASLQVTSTKDAFAPVVAIRKAPRRGAEIGFRHFDGALWEPWLNSRNTAQGSKDWIFAVSSELLWRHCKGAERSFVDAFGNARETERAWKRGPDLTDEPAVQRIAWKIRDLLFVDGVLHRRTMGPRFIVERHRAGEDEARVSISDVDYTQNRPALSAISFPAHESARMWEMVDDLALTTDADRSLLESAYHILDREALESVDHGPANLRATVNEAANGLQIQSLQEASRDVVRGLVLLRRSVAELDEQRAFGGVLPDDIPGMRDALLNVDATGLVERMHPSLRGTVRLGLRLFGLDPRASADDDALKDLVL